MIEVLISSSVLIVVIVLLRLLLRGRVRPGLQYALWGLVLLRLLIPGNWFQSPVSVMEAAAPAMERVETISERPVSGLPDYFVPAVTESAARVPSPADSLTLKSVAGWIWVAGAALLGLWFIFIHIRLGATLWKDRRLYSADYPAAVYVTGSLPSPCLFAGEVYLTEEAAADPVRAEYIIAHELTHRRHGDGLWSALRVVCLAVYWFNPLVWLAASLSRRDCEIFCDAATVKRLGEEHRFDYGRTLLDMAAVSVRPGDLICSATTMSGSGRILRERIKLIARRSKPSLLLGAAAVLAAAIAVGCTFSGAKETAVVSAPLPEKAGEENNAYDQEYYDEVARVFGPFLAAEKVSVYKSEYYTPMETSDLTLEEFVYMTDSWEFQYYDATRNLQLANDPDASIAITAEDGRSLYIWNDAGIYICEDGCILTEITLGGMTGDEFFSHLYKWADSKAELPVVIPDQFSGLPGVKKLPISAAIPVLENTQYGVIGILWTGHEGSYDHGALLEYLTGCTMTPVHWTEDNLSLPSANPDILITVDDTSIYLGVADVGIPHYAVTMDEEDYIVCVLDSGSQIYEDVKTLLTPSETTSGASVLPDISDRYEPPSIASGSTTGITVYPTDIPTPTPVPISTQAPLSAPAAAQTPAAATETTQSAPGSTPAPIACEPQNLWGESWEEGLPESAVSLLGN